MNNSRWPEVHKKQQNIFFFVPKSAFSCFGVSRFKNCCHTHLVPVLEARKVGQTRLKMSSSSQPMPHKAANISISTRAYNPIFWSDCGQSSIRLKSARFCRSVGVGMGRSAAGEATGVAYGANGAVVGCDITANTQISLPGAVCVRSRRNTAPSKIKQSAFLAGGAPIAKEFRGTRSSYLRWSKFRSNFSEEWLRQLHTGPHLEIRRSTIDYLIRIESHEKRI